MDLVGQTLGQYQIVEELGRGGMAVVYKAYQRSLNRYVAIKVLPPQLAFDEQFAQRFVREAQGAAALHHPSIVTIHDINREGDINFIVMEYLQGETLEQLLQSGPLPPPRIVHIVSQVADALEHAHRQRLIHRDVKPSNIMVDEQQNDRVTLMDFGLVRAAEGTDLTRTGTIIGTPEYMSPEQAEGAHVDQRTDIYSLGVVVFKMLTGQVPFSRSTPHAVLIAHITQDPPSITSINPSLSLAVEAVVHKAMAKDPQARYERATELARDLATAIAGQVPRGLKVPRKTKPTAPIRSHNRKWLQILGAVSGILLLGVCGAAIALALNALPRYAPPPPAPSDTPAPRVTPIEGVSDEQVDNTSTPTWTSTPRPTPVPKATATAAPTATSTPTSTPTSPPPTNTPKPRCSIGVAGPDDGANFTPGHKVSFHWTGFQPGEGEYYEVRVDGHSVGAAWFNSGLQQWEVTWEATEGGHTWQAFLMAADQHTVQCSSPARNMNASSAGSGQQPEPTRSQATREP